MARRGDGFRNGCWWLSGILGAALFLAESPCFAVDLNIGNVPLTPTVTPRINNLGTFKPYHVKDIETAQALQVSAYVYCRVECPDGNPITDDCESRPTSVQMRWSVIDATGTVITSVTSITHGISWTGFLFDNLFEVYHSELGPVSVPLAGLNLERAQYRVEAEVDPFNVIVESNEGNNGNISTDSFIYTIYSGLLNYGPIPTHLTSLSLAGLCVAFPGAPIIPLSAAVAEWTHEWGTTAFSPTPACYHDSLNGDGFSVDLTVAASTPAVNIGTLSGVTPSGLMAELRNVTLDSAGAHFSQGAVYLPEEVTFHELKIPGDPTQGYQSLGRNKFDFTSVAGDFVNIHDLPEWVQATQYAYHGYGHPFVLFADGARFNLGGAEGLLLDNPHAMHAHYPSYHNLNPRDPRGPSKQRKGFPANDVVFMGYDPTPIALAVVNPNGIQAADLNFADNSATLSTPRTSFPIGRIYWNAPFRTTVTDNRLVPQALPVHNYRMKARQTCPDDHCGDPMGPEGYDVATDNGDVWMTQDGSLASRFDLLGDNTEWGKWDSGSPTFRRDDSPKSGVFYLPGTYLPGTSDPSARRVAQVLLGSRLLDGDGGVPLTLSPLLEGGGGSDADQGNGFFAGLTMGPERLESLETGAGQLLEDDQLIRFNGNVTHDSFEITEYTKYFLRPSGVTGVFNTSFMGVLNIYGYDIDFRRFAFRQVYNKLDGKTFLDGTLDIPYPCDITVSFLELDLLCSGDLGSGEVDSEPETDWRHPDGVDNDGDTFTDEGNQVLSYWEAPISITGMAFVPTAMSGDACLDNENKELQLQTLDDVNGIENILTMKAIYPVNGKLKNQTMTSAAENTYDQPQSSSDPGFAIRMEKAYLNQLATYPMAQEGFLAAAGLTDLPLFNDMETLLHLDNPTPDGLELPDESFEIHVFRDESDSDTDKDGIPDAYGSNATSYRDQLANGEDAPESGDPRPRAKYSWPASGLLELNYPLTYNRSDGTTSPQFLGIKKVYNLISDSNPVITINSVPDYINPVRTKFSFGVSADFAAIANFQVNLNDLGDIDDFLHTYLGVDPSFSLEDIFQNVLDAENLVKSITGGDLTQVLAPVLDSALDAGPVDSVITDFADAINAVNRIPQEVSARTADVLDEFRAQLLAEITAGAVPLNGPTGLLQSLFDDLAAYVAAPEDIVNAYPGNPHTPAEMEAFLEALEDIRNRLSQVEDLLEDAHAGIATAKNEVNDLAGDLDAALADATALLTSVKNILSNPATGLGDFLGIADNPIIQTVDDVKDTVRDVLDAIESVDIHLIADALQAAAQLAGGDIDTSLLNDIVNTIDSLTHSLEEIIDQAESLLQSQYAAMPTLFADAEALLDQVLASLNQVNTQMDAVTATLIGYLESADEQVVAVEGVLGSLSELLSAELPDPDLGAIPDYNALLDLGRDKLNDLAATLVDDLLSEFPTGMLHNELVNIDGLISGDPLHAFQYAFVEAIEDLVGLPLEQAQAELVNDLQMILDQAVSVLPTPDADDIKGIIRNAVLNSGPVTDLNEAFYDLLSPVADAVDEVATQFTSSINNLIQQAIEAITEAINAAMDSVTSAIADFDLVGGRLDGYAIVNQEELEQLHIEAEFTFGGTPDPTTYFAALDITSWNSENGKGACVDDGTGLIDAVISTRDISAEMLGLPIGIKEAALGFTLDGGIPIGVFGRVYTSGELNFEAAAIRDIGLEFGMGAIENYVGGKAAGRFDSYTINMIAFYFGKTCDYGVLERLDPEAADFIGEMVPLVGIYVRGALSAPIINYGCALTIGAGVDLGIWLLNDTYGGLFGGSVYGEAVCLVSIRGKITFMGQKSGEVYEFAGNGWIAGGIGSCEPGDWNSIADVRDDDWCLTGDAKFSGTYSTENNDFELNGPDFSCCD